MSYRVAELARIAGVSPHTVRYYVVRGLLRGEKDPRSGYRRFSERDVLTLAFARRAQALGFTLREVGAIVAMSQKRQSPCPMVREIVHRRLGEFSVELASLHRTCQRMRSALRKWRRMPDSTPKGNEICHLIESVGAPDLTFERLEGRGSPPARAPRRSRRT